MSIPKVFISYSHDSQKQKKWVLDLATRLQNNGIDAIIDQWKLRPGDDLPHFMEKHLAGSDYFVMVCKDKYVEIANAGTGGVGYEKMIVTAQLLANIDSNKVVPIIRRVGTYKLPTFLKTKLFIDFSSDDDYEYGIDELVRTFHNSPIFEKPEIGNNPFTPTAQETPEKKGDAVRKLMKIVASRYEADGSNTPYKLIKNQLGISRIMLNVMIKELTDQDLLGKSTYNCNIYLTNEGKRYAIQHKLI